jgi:hypothetical protein
LTIGTGAGALGGGGMGYLASKDPELRRRSALVGAVTGAGVGALAGGLAARGGIHPQKYVDDLAAAAGRARASGIAAGHNDGFNAAFNHIGNTPEVAKAILKKMTPEVRQQAVSPSVVKDVLRNMDPKAREGILKSFSEGFGARLRRWFGG